MLGGDHQLSQGNRHRLQPSRREMILRPQSRGDPGVPVHKGTEPSWRSRDQPASPAGRRLILFCALSGYNQGVMLNSAQSTESGAVMQQLC